MDRQQIMDGMFDIVELQNECMSPTNVDTTMACKDENPPDAKNITAGADNQKQIVQFYIQTTDVHPELDQVIQLLISNIIWTTCSMTVHPQLSVGARTVTGNGSGVNEGGTLNFTHTRLLLRVEVT